VFGNLVVRHLVNRFHVRNLSPEPLTLDAILQLALGFAGTENKDGVHVLQQGNDLVVLFVEVALDLAFQLVFGHEIIAGVSALHSRPTSGMSRFVVAGNDLANVFSLVSDPQDNRLVMVDPYARVDCHKCCPSDYSARVIPALIRECHQVTSILVHQMVDRARVFNAADLQVQPWGTMELRFSDCSTADLTYAGPAAWGTGSRRLAHCWSRF